MPVDLGLGAAEAVSVPGAGRVVGSSSKAVYVQLPAGLVALGTPRVPRGPLHLRAGVALPRVRVGDRVTLTPSWLEVGPLLVDLRGARLWSGRLPPASAPARLAVELLAEVPPPALSGKVDLGLVRRADLAGLAALLGGAGPGLTPAGDDCLAGILVVAHLRGLAVDGNLPGSVPTNAIARAFLRWAARGQSIEPVHRFLLASAAGDRRAAAAGLRDVLALGHSSGACLALGLRVGLQHLPAAAPATAGSTVGVHAGPAVRPQVVPDRPDAGRDDGPAVPWSRQEVV